MAMRYWARRVSIPDLVLRGRCVSLPAGSRPLTYPSRYSQGGQRPEVDVEELIRKDPKTALKVLREEEIARLRAKIRPEVDVEELIRKDPKTVAKVLQEEEIAMLRAKFRAGREAMEELKRREKYSKLWLGTCAATGVILGLLAAAADIRRQGEQFIRSF